MIDDPVKLPAGHAWMLALQSPGATDHEKEVAGGAGTEVRGIENKTPEQVFWDVDVVTEGTGSIVIASWVVGPGMVTQLVLVP